MTTPQKFKRVRVLVTRADLNTIPTDIFEHEIPILLSIYGDGNVAVVEDVDLEPAELEEGIDGEFARLTRCYRRPNEQQSPATRVFPGAAALASALGVTYQPHTGLKPTMPESYAYDGKAEAAKAEAAKPKRGRPPKAEDGDE